MMPLEDSDTECPFCGKAREGKAPPHHLPYGTRLNDKYLVGAAIGEGGFGITYIGRETMLDIKVAIKEYFPASCANRYNTESLDVHESLSADKKELFASGKDTFLSEARALARFSDEKGIVNVREYFQTNNTAYIVMEYLEGETLKEYLEHKQRLSPDSVLEILDPVINSLRVIHRSGLIHRDINPQNIILSKKGAKLLDFGAARYVDTNGENSYSVILKPGYAPEEQYRRKGNQGPWTDIYALCATIYKCVTGIIPDASLERLIKDEIKSPSALGISVDPNFEKALMKGMSVLQKDRYRTIDELMDGFAGKDASLSNTPSDNDVTVHLGYDRNTSAAAGDDRTYKLSNSQPDNMTAMTEPVNETASSVSVQPIIAQFKTPDAQNNSAKRANGYSPQQNYDRKPLDVQPITTPQTKVPAKTVGNPRTKVIVAAIAAIVVIGAGIAAFALLSGKDDGNDTVSVEQTVASSYTYTSTDTSEEKTPEPTDAALANKKINKQTIQELCANPKLSSITINNCTFDSDVSFEDFPERLAVLKITDCKELPLLKGISKLTRLNSLGLINCGVTDEQLASIDLRKLSNLTNLYLNNNALTNISALSEIKTLCVVNVNRNKLTSLSGLEKAIKLQKLYAAGNELTDLNGIVNCTVLTHAALNDNKLTNADVLKKSSNTLEAIDLRNNQLSDISFLEGTAKLQLLFIDNNKIKTLAPLSGSKKLFKFSASNNLIENVSELWGLEELKYIVLDNNKITDVNGILSFNSGYTLLSLNNNSISELIEINEHGVGVDVLMLCSNPIKASSLGEKKNKFSGVTLFVSYAEGMDFDKLWAKFNYVHINIADYPLDKQLAFEEDAKKSNKTPAFNDIADLKAQMDNMQCRYMEISEEGFEPLSYGNSKNKQ